MLHFSLLLATQFSLLATVLVQCTSLLAILVPALLLSYLLITTKIQLTILLPWSLINTVLQLQVAINSLLLCYPANVLTREETKNPVSPFRDDHFRLFANIPCENTRK
jgi:hypothetical protein